LELLIGVALVIGAIFVYQLNPPKARHRVGYRDNASSMTVSMRVESARHLTFARPRERSAIGL
jgi:hypothetical protein